MATPGSGPSIAKLIGEGYSRPLAEQELPIDINYQRVLEWMITRQKLPNDWHKRLQAIEAKAAESAKQLPPALLASLPGGAEAPIDYFRAVQIRDKLAETADRTLFGGLSGQAGIWDKVVKAYEQGGVYLGEAAQAMVQAVDYEIPFLRKQQAKHAQAIADGERKHSEYLKSAAAAASNYRQECQKLSIAGANVAQELRQLGDQLPALFMQAIQQLQQPAVSEAMQHYAEFIHYAHSGKGASGSDAAGAAVPAELASLAEVREGRTVPPAAAATGVGTAAAPGDVGAAPDINWDILAADGGGGAATSADIDWDLGVLAPLAAPNDAAGADGGIDWDLGAVELPAAGEDEPPAAAGDAAAPVEVNWDIELTDAAITREDGGGGAASTPPVAAVAAEPAAGAAAEALTGDAAAAARLEHDKEYRAQLMDDIQELRAFLAQRRQELQTGSSDLLHALLPDSIQSVDAAKAAAMLAAVNAAIELLNAPKLRQLLLLTSSPRYLERTSRELQRKAGQEAKLLAAAQETVARRHEARAALAALGPKVAEQVARVRLIKAAIEAKLAGMLNGRRINILGEVNNVLAGAAAGT